MFGHCPPEMGALGEDERVQHPSNRVEVRHHDYSLQQGINKMKPVMKKIKYITQFSEIEVFKIIFRFIFIYSSIKD